MEVPRPLYWREKKTPIPVEWEVWWAPEPVWTFWRREKPIPPAGIRTLDRPARKVVTVFTVLSRFPSNNWTKNKQIAFGGHGCGPASYRLWHCPRNVGVCPPPCHSCAFLTLTCKQSLLRSRSLIHSIALFICVASSHAVTTPHSPFALYVRCHCFHGG